MDTRHVVVVGTMGAGKSTAADGVAAELGRDHVDGDDLLQARHGATGREIAATQGVDHLHDLEARTALDALASEPPAVISTAASVVTDERVRAALGDHLVVWLQLDPATVVERQAGGDHRRPMDVDEVAALQQRRHDAFAPVADVIVDAAPPPDQVVAAIVAQLPEGLGT